MRNLTRLFFLFVLFLGSAIPSIGQQSQSFVFDSTLYLFRIQGNENSGYRLSITTPKFREDFIPSDTTFLNRAGISVGNTIPPNQQLAIPGSRNGSPVFVLWQDSTQVFDPTGQYRFSHTFEATGKTISVFRTRLRRPSNDNDPETIEGSIDSLIYDIRIDGSTRNLVPDGVNEGSLPFSLAHDFSKEAFDIYFFESLKQLWGEGLDRELKVNSDLRSAYQDILNELYDVSVRYRDLSPLLTKIDSLELEKDVPAGVLALNKKAGAEELTSKGIGLECPPVIFDVKGASINVVRNKMYMTFSLEEAITHKPALVMFNNYGIPVKSYRKNKPYISNFFCDGKEFAIKLDQLIGYTADQSTGNYVGNVRNTTFHMRPGDSTVLIRRRFGDFFNIVAFSDALGIADPESPNGQLMTELDFDLPLSSRHLKKKYFFPYLKATAGFLRLGTKDPYRDMTLDTIPVGNASFTTRYFVHQTDIVQFRNFDFSGFLCIGGISGRDGILSAYLEAGGGAIRTKLRRQEGFRVEAGDTLPDFRDFNVWTTFPQIQGRFEVIPNDWLGFDLRVGASAYTTQDNVHVGGGDLQSETRNANFQPLGSRLVDRGYLVYDLNVYVLPGIKKDRANGIYARVRLMDHLTAKAFYPQILIGYGANVRKYIR